MDLQLGLALPIHDPAKGSEPKDQEGPYKKWVSNKRCHGEAFEEDSSGKSQLLAWSGRPNEEDDPCGRRGKFSCSINKFRYNEGADDDDQVVGWPPINSWRKEFIHGHPPHRDLHENVRPAGKENGEPGHNMFVKVKMEGVAIVRKINLRTYQSYNSLKGALIAMFSRYNRDEFKDHAGYALTYQDKEGDWLLAGDIPWPNFVESVRRLEIQRTRD
ncbi:auxin-induced protein 22D [Syzygium oleosum]|uniref:auxin-induced protein 22D n=1 Tax=Syzygium oleosum TaxID=219896 RepID=UPI0011D235F1|nr:auxin-induced protein 22D [Syzygium oleosum]